MADLRYTCAEIHHADGKSSYEILDLDNNFIAELWDFNQVETLLRHLNNPVRLSGAVLH